MRRSLLLLAVLAVGASVAPDAGATTGSWVRKADMPVGEQNAAIAKDVGEIYVIGGLEDERIVRVYDPGTNTWTQATYKLPKGRWGAAAATVHGHILLFGGGRGDFDFVGNRNIYDVDPTAGTVASRARAPVRLELASAIHIPNSDRVLVVGGHEQQEGGPRLRHTPVFVYDASQDAWHRRANLPVTRSLIGGTLVASRHHIYYYGGLVDIAFGPISRAVFRYNRRSDRWTRVATLPMGTNVPAPAATGADGRIYIVGSLERPLRAGLRPRDRRLVGRPHDSVHARAAQRDRPGRHHLRHGRRIQLTGRDVHRRMELGAADDALNPVAHCCITASVMASMAASRDASSSLSP